MWALIHEIAHHESMNQTEVEIYSLALEEANAKYIYILGTKDLEDELTAEEQASLLELTGETDLASVSLNDLDIAAQTLANTMTTMANELATAMGMIQRGEADNLQYNSATGHFEVTKNMTAEEIGQENLTQDELDQLAANPEATFARTVSLGGEQAELTGDWADAQGASLEA